MKDDIKTDDPEYLDVPWFLRDPDQIGLNPNSRRSILYYKQLNLATPPWANKEAIDAIYKERDRLRALGYNVVVDHMTPLNHPHVCGLHCEDNLQIIGHLENERKSNHYWPDMWEEQIELIELEVVEQYSLSL